MKKVSVNGILFNISSNEIIGIDLALGRSDIKGWVRTVVFDSIQNTRQAILVFEEDGGCWSVLCEVVLSLAGQESGLDGRPKSDGLIGTSRNSDAARVD